MPKTVALIVAAGQGLRAQTAAAGAPKQYADLAGKPVLRWSVETLLAHPGISGVRIVARPEDAALYEKAVAGLNLPAAIPGGATRQDSVRLGLEACADAKPDRVLIHDAARPFLSHALIERILGALDTSDAVLPVVPVADTLRRKSDQGYEIVKRDDLSRAQTPQGFRFDAIVEAHNRFASESVTDDIALAERAGLSLALVQGEEINFKLTTPEDFSLGHKIAMGTYADIRTGTGIDAHQFTAGDHVWLCGIKVAHDHGLEGHSDADCGLHALTDAILGAISDADIGQHFGPTDPRWKGAPSHLFLAHAASLVRERGGVISHVDVTLICERPKVAPHRDAMRARIAEILGLDIGRVSVKATTTDSMGFTGRREGMAAQAVATVRLP